MGYALAVPLCSSRSFRWHRSSSGNTKILSQRSWRLCRQLSGDGLKPPRTDVEDLRPGTREISSLSKIWCGACGVGQGRIADAKALASENGLVISMYLSLNLRPEVRTLCEIQCFEIQATEQKNLLEEWKYWWLQEDDQRATTSGVANWRSCGALRFGNITLYYIYLHMHISMCIHLHMHIPLHWHIHTHMHLHLQIHLHLHLHIRVYIYIYMYIYIHTHSWKYM